MRHPGARAARAVPATLVVVGLLAAAPAAMSGWARPADSASPINQTPTTDAVDAAMASIGGVPHVAWRETDGQNFEVRVSKLTVNGWERVGQAINPASPINQDSLGAAKDVALADVGGVPYVAWTEGSGGTDQVRVARLNAVGTGWDKVGAVVSPASPVNLAPNRNAVGVSLAAVGGVPYVAWTEFDGTNYEVRVARPAADGNSWERVGIAVNPASPINNSPARNARHPVIASVAGAPVVAWTETDGTNHEVRVARLNAAQTDWDHLGRALRPGSPINQNLARDASFPSLQDIGGTPYVAWLEAQPGGAQVRVARLSSGGAGWERVGQGLDAARPVNVGTRGAIAPSLALVAGRPWVAWGEDDGRNRELRVARLNAAGTGWEQPVGGVSPLNASPNQSVDPPSLAVVGEVPYVAWPERDGQNREIRVGRLEPTVLTSSVTASEQAARMTASLRSYGVPFQVGFTVSGPGGDQVTRPGALSGDPATASAVAFGLRPGSTYRWRAYAVMGAGGLTASGPELTLSTSTVTRLRVTPVAKIVNARPGVLKGLRFRTSVPGIATLRVFSGSRQVTVVRKRVVRGVNTVRIRTPRSTGVYRVTVRVAATGGRADSAAFRLRVIARR